MRAGKKRVADDDEELQLGPHVDLPGGKSRLIVPAADATARPVSQRARGAAGSRRQSPRADPASTVFLAVVLAPRLCC